MNPSENFHHQTTINVRFHDIDAFGHVNNARFLNYLEEARQQYALDVLQWSNRLDSIPVIVASVKIDFKSPIFLGNMVVVYTRISRLGTKSFDYENIITTADGSHDAKIAATCTVTLVTYDYQSQQSMPIPDPWRETVMAFETGLTG
jgi:YbgC/YbaW family acyl-CoA thioester hydrolase